MTDIAKISDAIKLEQYRALIIGLQGDQVTTKEQSDKDAPGLLWAKILDYLSLGATRFNIDLRDELERRRIMHIFSPQFDVIIPDTSFWAKIVESFPTEPSNDEKRSAWGEY